MIHQHAYRHIVVAVQSVGNGINESTFPFPLTNVERGNENTIIGIGCMFQDREIRIILWEWTGFQCPWHCMQRQDPNWRGYLTHCAMAMCPVHSNSGTLIEKAGDGACNDRDGWPVGMLKLQHQSFLT